MSSEKASQRRRRRLASSAGGMPFGGEVLVPGAPFQPENGYLGMWCVSGVEASIIERSHANVARRNWEKTGARPCPRTRRRRRRRR